jgi:hypothetical protein
MSMFRSCGVLNREPCTANRSAAEFPGSFAWPLIHWKVVFARHISRSRILAMMGLIKSLFSTSFPEEFLQLFPSHFWNHSVRHFME